MGRDKSSTDARFGVKIITAGLLCLALSSVSPAAAVTGYSVYGVGDLVAVDLETGALQVIGDGGLGAVWALAADPAGELYAAVDEFPTVRLYRLDRATGVSTLVGDLGDDLEVTGLTFDANGTLWMVADDALFTVDPTSAASTLIGVPDRSLVGLAARGGAIYALSQSTSIPELVTVDPGTAATTLVAPLPDLSFGGLAILLPSLAFDAQGALWTSVLVLPPILPADFPQYFFRIPDAEAPVPEQTFSVSGPPNFAGLAIAPGPFDPVVEIPTLGRAGAVTLAVLIFGGGLRLIRRRRDPGLAV